MIRVEHQPDIVREIPREALEEIVKATWQEPGSTIIGLQPPGHLIQMPILLATIRKEAERRRQAN